MEEINKNNNQSQFRVRKYDFSDKGLSKKEYHKKWYDANKDKLKEELKQSYDEHKDQLKEKAKSLLIFILRSPTILPNDLLLIYFVLSIKLSMTETNRFFFSLRNDFLTWKKKKNNNFKNGNVNIYRISYLLISRSQFTTM